jgi:hypothetical protein
MTSHARIRKSVPSSPRGSGRHLPPTKAAPNPLWAIAIGMGVFFAFTALIMMFT